MISTTTTATSTPARRPTLAESMQQIAYISRRWVLLREGVPEAAARRSARAYARQFARAFVARKAAEQAEAAAEAAASAQQIAA